MNYIKRKLKTTSGLLTLVMGLSIIVLGVSYATFVITTDKYKASEMLISNLTYGINITGDGNSTINNKTVTVAANKTTTLQVKITSLNDITSNYSLEYKILSGSGTVTYLSSTTYTPTGNINKTGTEKTITVIIQATTAMNIEFNVSGGYTYNGVPSNLTGYSKITGTSHKVVVTSTNTSYGTITNGSQVINNGGTVTINLSPKSGYKYSSNTCGGTFSGNTLTIKNLTSNKTCTVTFIKSQLTLYAQLLQDNPTRLTRTDFSTVFTDSNTGTLYKASGNETEDGSDVYYFAGNAQNNWVKFGKDQDNADLYWRIIRTNEDGSIRLLYIGPDKATTSAFIKIDGIIYNNRSYNVANSLEVKNSYVGYMFSGQYATSLAQDRQNQSNSNIKGNTDLWYIRTINVKTDAGGNTYDKYVSKTAIYCNDRSSDEYRNNAAMNFGARKRLINSKTPSYKCGNNASRILFSDANVADKFSVSTSKGGNGKLTYPIAQMTVDEIAYAGGVYFTVSEGWYYYNSAGKSVVGSDKWWTMTPLGRTTDYTSMFTYDGAYGRISSSYVSTENTSYVYPGIRPVLSLKSCVKVTSGNGSSTTPYEVTIDSTCASAEN